ncbi:hypothetical protein Tco_0396183 [Tanacetum coccineum]
MICCFYTGITYWTVKRVQINPFAAEIPSCWKTIAKNPPDEDVDFLGEILVPSCFHITTSGRMLLLCVLRVTLDHKGVRTQGTITMNPQGHQESVNDDSRFRTKISCSFHKMTDAKEMWVAIKSRFGRLHKGYDRFQSLLSQLEIHGAGVITKDAKSKIPKISTFCLGPSTASSPSPQNVAFVSENTSSTNEVSTAYCVPNPSGQNSQYEQTSSYSLLANQSSCPQLDHEDLEQIDEYDLEEMDLKKWT